MTKLDLNKISTGLPAGRASVLRDWDRTLRAGNYPETTRYNYVLAAAQLGRYLADEPRTRTPRPPTGPRQPARTWSCSSPG